VDFCAREGVTQFVDIGSGLPTNENVHEIAQRVNADSRVVYADSRVVYADSRVVYADSRVVYADHAPVVAHARALLSGAQTAAVRGDVCRPDDILGAPEVRRTTRSGPNAGARPPANWWTPTRR
jgi:S-adenosyl methyltransferase